MAAKRQLAYTVWVTGEDGNPTSFGPGDTVPKWAAAQMGAHCFDDGSDDDGDAADIPPRAGAGSGKDAWAAYAASLDVDVTDAKNRDEIIAAIEAAGHPVDPA